jgi:hypothetical protein
MTDKHPAYEREFFAKGEDMNAKAKEDLEAKVKNSEGQNKCAAVGVLPADNISVNSNWRNKIGYFFAAIAAATLIGTCYLGIKQYEKVYGNSAQIQCVDVQKQEMTDYIQAKRNDISRVYLKTLKGQKYFKGNAYFSGKSKYGTITEIKTSSETPSPRLFSALENYFKEQKDFPNKEKECSNFDFMLKF